GFSLNGRWLKFNGVSMHHDQGALGAVADYAAMYRQMRILKDMGVNSIRITHNPADDKLIEIAEDMGLLVVDEAFDTWYGGKKLMTMDVTLNKQRPNQKQSQIRHGQSMTLNEWCHVGKIHQPLLCGQ